MTNTQRPTKVTNPYSELGDSAFWRTAVANRSLFDINKLWKPKFLMRPEDPVSTYGSCFAQHIGRALRQRNHNWLVTETAPSTCDKSLAQRFNYGVFSSRTGNIYTTSLLHQWMRWATNKEQIPDEIWIENDNYRDPFRPAIEPNGFHSAEELSDSRGHTLNRFKQSIEEARFLVFTLGLTESWINSNKRFEYPMCPGTVAGQFDQHKHKFVNQNFDDVSRHLIAALDLVRQLNPKIQVILTVSPVPLTATASGNHVLVATMYSKSVLRAVAGEMAMRHDWIDYFPSYEIINSPAFGGVFFDPNKRNVNPAGVKFVMSQFFAGKNRSDSVRKTEDKNANSQPDPDVSDEACEEALLDAFSIKA